MRPVEAGRGTLPACLAGWHSAEADAARGRCDEFAAVRADRAARRARGRPGRHRRRPRRYPDGPLAAWLVTDERAELIAQLRRLAAAHRLVPRAGRYAAGGLDITPHPVVHTSHDTFGYLIGASGRRVAWAPEFLEWPNGRRAWTCCSPTPLAGHARSGSRTGPTGARPASMWHGKRPARGCGGWCSPTSGGPRSRQSTLATSRRLASSAPTGRSTRSTRPDAATGEPARGATAPGPYAAAPRQCPGGETAVRPVSARCIRATCLWCSGHTAAVSG